MGSEVRVGDVRFERGEREHAGAGEVDSQVWEGEKRKSAWREEEYIPTSLLAHARAHRACTRNGEGESGADVELSIRECAGGEGGGTRGRTAGGQAHVDLQMTGRERIGAGCASASAVNTSESAGTESQSGKS